MKKILLAGLISLFFVGVAVAAPMTWTDEYSPGAQYINSSFSYVHDITDEGFIPFQDVVTSYSLFVSLADDRRDPWYQPFEVAHISQPGLLGDGFYNFDYAVNDFGASIAGLIQLNTIGQLSVTITSWIGDFMFNSSTLVADGYSPVPEPGTLLLLGSGLAGLALYRRRSMNK